MGEFYMKAGAAGLSGDGHLVVSPELFEILSQGAKTPYITYGSPKGVKVYKPGTKAQCDEFDNRNAY